MITIKNPSFLRQCFCAAGHFIVTSGALLKSAREINEMSRMGMRKYLSTTVSNDLWNPSRQEIIF